MKTGDGVDRSSAGVGRAEKDFERRQRSLGYAADASVDCAAVAAAGAGIEGSSAAVTEASSYAVPQIEL